MTPVLETPRLVLREMGVDDLDFVAAMLAHPEVMQFWPKCLSRDEARAWLLRQQERYAACGHGYWLAVEKATGRPVGQAGLLTVELDGIEEPAPGYMIHRPFWREGFATEAAAACLDYAFNVRRYDRVICPIRPENVPSLRVALKLGFRPERYATFAGFAHLILVASRADRDA